MSFKVGDKVIWTSQAQGYSKTKVGIIDSVVMAGQKPNRDKYLFLYHTNGLGLMPRKEESYVVMVGNRPYYPLVKNLRLFTMKEYEEQLTKEYTRKTFVNSVAQAKWFLNYINEHPLP